MLPNKTTMKQLPGAKNAFTSAMETLALVGFALACVHGNQVAPLAIAGTTAVCFLLNCSLSLLADARDAPGDRVGGTKSFAVLYGVPAALRMAAACGAAACIAACLSFSRRDRRRCCAGDAGTRPFCW